MNELAILKLAGCVIVQDDKILLLHRNTPKREHWEIPGGKIDEGEDPETAAIREVIEELGIEVVIQKLLGEKGFAEDDYTLHYTWYLAKITSGDATIMEPETFEDLSYFSIDDMQKIKLSAGAQAFLTLLKSEDIKFD